MPTCRPIGQEGYKIRSNLTVDGVSRAFFCVADGHIVLLRIWSNGTDFQLGTQPTTAAG